MKICCIKVGHFTSFGILLRYKTDKTGYKWDITYKVLNHRIYQVE